MRLKTLALLGSLLLPSTLQAAWYSAQAEVVIGAGGKRHAEQRAMEQALEQALYQSGASLMALQQLHSGALLSQGGLRPSNEVRQLRLLERRSSNGKLMVAIEANITPLANVCPEQRYRHPVAVTRFGIRHPQQAAQGDLQGLGDGLARRLFQELGLQQQGLVGRSYLDDVRWEDPGLSQQWGQAVGEQGDSQLVIGAEITDLSVQQQSGLKALLPLGKKQRNLSLELYLMDGLSGETLSRRLYQVTSNWSAKSAPVSSTQFWQTEFGTELDRLVRRVAVDLAADYRCQPLSGRILAIEAQEVLVNLGRRSGLKIGDQLSLSHLKQWQLDDGRWKTVENQGGLQLEVVEVNQDHAVLVPVPATLAINLRRGDRVQLAPITSML